MFEVSQAAFAHALVDPSIPIPRDVTTARGEADPARFAVYRNNVFVGLTQALAKRFPVVQQLVGEAFFAGMARVYAGLERPRSPVMFEYGDGFADFIERFEPARGLAYLSGVARVEAAWTRAYHAEDASPVALADLAAIGADDLDRLQFVAHGSASLIASPYPVGSIWAAHQGATVEPVRASHAETVLVIRPTMDVRVVILPSEDAAFAQALFAGQTLQQASERASLVDAPFDVGTALVGLISLGAFGAIVQRDNPT